jgi:transcriptional regulator with XRE-family HTH domain
MEIKLNLKAARTQAGLYQKEAGDLLGVSQWTISKWETGEIRPAVEMRPIIAKTYGLEAGQIDWGESDDD